MTQIPLLQPQSWSVQQVTRYLKDLLESDHNLADVWVQGEISNYSRPSSGHLYFTLKDSKAALKCVMWRSLADRQRVLPKHGDAVEVHGSISIYEVSGQYQLYADTIRPLGEGALYQEYLRLKDRLEAEGLFDPDRKRAIPVWPRRIGIVTSPTGAALRDMLNTLRRRYPLVDVVLAPSAVQGNEAPDGIAQAIIALNDCAAPDVILVARGGGSIEDLWAFNDEKVARAIANSDVPVISGVGHETDFTIADFVADQRAPTPTAAAELATPDRAELHATLQEEHLRLIRATLGQTGAQRYQLEDMITQLTRTTPATRIQRDRQQLDDLNRQARRVLSHQMQLRVSLLSGLEQRLEALNPLAVLQRGFAVVSQADGEIVRSTEQVKAGDTLDVRVHDGEFRVRAEKDEKK